MLGDLPDYAQAKQLAAALWRHDGQGRGAALIVGAGISTMAKLASSAGTKPPLWGQLAQSLRERLYPGRKDEAPPDALRLAQEYRSYLGQAALDAHLRELIADQTWFPSGEHRDLLQLPWADVLTTNYDSLLERTASQLVSPAYDVVRTAADLAHARAPRIVKLHGNIADGTHLILTEDDYRTYPVKHAAMVNLARQVFIENELCLLGFSGDDPNFLQWSGWVRDHLQSSQRKIYLVGVLNLSPPTRRLLEERNIAPIDLAPLVQDSPEPHAAATRAFIAFLQASQPAPPYEWKLEAGKPEAFQMASTQEERDRLSAQARLRIRATRWGGERKTYPGWLVCPHTKRQFELKGQCAESARDMEIGFGALDLADQRTYVGEFVWRCRTAMYTPCSKQVAALSGFIARNTADWEVAEVDAALLLLTQHRDAGEDEKFRSLAENVGAAVMNAEQRSILHFERCLLARDRMQLKGLESLLEELDGDDVAWKLRKAALACELNLWDAARAAWAQAGADIQRRESADRNAIWIRSRRAWLNHYRMLDFRSQEGRDARQSRTRSAQDRVAHCDPWDEFQIASQELLDAEVSIRIKATESVVPTFHPGRYLVRNRRKENVPLDSALTLRADIQRWTEWAGVPERLENSSFRAVFIQALSQAPSDTLAWHLLLARGVTARSRDSVLERNFSRLSIAKMSAGVRIGLQRAMLEACRYWADRLLSETGRTRRRGIVDRLSAAMEVLARVVIAADVNSAMECFEFCTSLSRQDRALDRNLYEAMERLMDGSLSALTRHDATVTMACVAFPLSMKLKDQFLRERWPIPAAALSRIEKGDPASLSFADAALLEQLLGYVHGGVARAEAVVRLRVAWKAGVMSQAQEAAFGAALWAKRDNNEPPLPKDLPYHLHVLLDLPLPEGIDVVELLRQRFFVLQPHARPDEESLRGMLHLAASQPPVLPHPATAVGILDDYLELHPRLQMWFDDQRAEPHEIEDRRRLLGRTISHVLLPALDIGQLDEARLTRLLNFMQHTGCAGAVAGLPYFLASLPDRCSTVLRAVRESLLRPRWWVQQAGSEAVTTWLTLPQLRDALMPAEAAHLEEMLLAALATGNWPGREGVLQNAVLLLPRASSSGYGDRLVSIVEELIDATAPENVQAGGEQEIFFSMMRAELVRAASALAQTGVSSQRLQQYLLDSAISPLPEIRYATSGRDRG